ncbi:Uncharacterised protein [Oligella urethralis]|uniref:Uncharacterized protein n=1 Tax=Oligella urethralis TaxID=90245 RepID=A0A2X1WMU2_9BURK|nr:Uncharacterised protein [Oligella urethralis]
MASVLWGKRAWKAVMQAKGQACRKVVVSFITELE